MYVYPIPFRLPPFTLSTSKKTKRKRKKKGNAKKVTRSVHLT